MTWPFCGCSVGALVATTSVLGVLVVLLVVSQMKRGDELVNKAAVTVVTYVERLRGRGGQGGEEEVVMGVNVDEAFERWMRETKRTYATKEERDARRSVFAESVRRVYAHNARLKAGPTKATTTTTTGEMVMGLTAFADLTDEEFLREVGAVGPAAAKTGEECYASITASRERRRAANLAMERADLETLAKSKQVPVAMDWRDRGVVRHVRNQKSCGSCWAFAAVGAMEARHVIRTGRDVQLSEQQLVDCSRGLDGAGNQGCGGGWPANAFAYVQAQGGIDDRDAYPYEARDGPCRFSKWRVASRVRGVVNVTEFDEDALTRAVGLSGPVAVAIQVRSDFKLYAGGVYANAECGKTPQDLTHAILAVGYDVAVDGTPYWVLKNSWGESWGLNGFFLLRRGANECGIATCASYPE